MKFLSTIAAICCLVLLGVTFSPLVKEGIERSKSTDEKWTHVHLYDRDGIYKTYTVESSKYFFSHGLISFTDPETGEKVSLSGNIKLEHFKK